MSVNGNMRQCSGNFQTLLHAIIILGISGNSFDNVTDSSSDQQLMLAYQSGDVQAFELLYKKHKDALYRFVLRHGLEKDIAEEVYQEIWSAIIKSRNNYQPEAKFTTWIYQIARNRIADHYRNTKSHFSLVDDNIEADEMVDDHSEPETATFRERLLATLSALPFAQRQCFLMYYEAALSISDIASITETNHEAVKSQLRYAVNKLKTRLGKDDAN